MKVLITLFIFFTILFVYIHILFQLKQSNELEVYELEYPSKDKLEEVCELKQPLLFNIEEKLIFSNILKQDILKNYSSFDLKIRNTEEKDTIKYLPFTFQNSITLLNEDKKGVYYSEKNGDFLQETGLIKTFLYNDEFFRPPLLCNSQYDVMFGSINCCTPLRYEISCRNYILINEGTIKIKLAPPKNSKYLLEEKDYENMEFSSPINPWIVDSKYKNDLDKVKFLELTLTKEQCFYIPPYWWYSLQFQKDTNLSFLKYYSFMNNLAILPTLCMSFLQLQNIESKIMKKINIEENNISLNLESINNN